MGRPGLESHLSYEHTAAAGLLTAYLVHGISGRFCLGHDLLCHLVSALLDLLHMHSSQ